jgi:hypothetical protein
MRATRAAARIFSVLPAFDRRVIGNCPARNRRYWSNAPDALPDNGERRCNGRYRGRFVCVYPEKWLKLRSRWARNMDHRPGATLASS